MPARLSIGSESGGGGTVTGVPVRTRNCVIAGLAGSGIQQGNVANAAVTSWMAAAPADIPGWHRDFVDNFDGPLNTAVWARYVGGARTGGSLSSYDINNVYTSSGQLVVRTHQTDGVWTSGGMSSGRGFNVAQGKWSLKARFDRAYGIGYVFVLYPQGGGWPPEIDIAEGTAGGPQVMSTLHWDPDNKRKSFFKTGIDMTQWHTYGVIMNGDAISYTVDGAVWSSFSSYGVPKIPMWFGVQAGAKDCAQSTNECTTSATILDSGIYVDWIAHWSAA